MRVVAAPSQGQGGTSDNSWSIKNVCFLIYLNQMLKLSEYSRYNGFHHNPVPPRWSSDEHRSVHLLVRITTIPSTIPGIWVIKHSNDGVRSFLLEMRRFRSQLAKWTIRHFPQLIASCGYANELDFDIICFVFEDYWNQHGYNSRSQKRHWKLYILGKPEISIHSCTLW